MILFSLDDDVMMMVQWSITYVQVHKGQQQNNPRPYVALVHLLCMQVRVPNPKYNSIKNILLSSHRIVCPIH